MTHLHAPLRSTRDLMASLFEAPRTAREIQREAYAQLLDRVDWQYEAIDDGARYAERKARFDEARMVQREIDPDGSLWNQRCLPNQRVIA